MKLFACQACGQPLFFETMACPSCGRRLGYAPERREVHALEPAADAAGFWRLRDEGGPPRALCANAAHEACHWLLDPGEAEGFCRACRHNRTIPELSSGDRLVRWRTLEAAKRRLIYTLDGLGLPHATREEDPGGLAFDFLADPADHGLDGPAIMTGHDRGLVTIALAEADPAERERRRVSFEEPYRTLLGHFRHEVGHYYWNVLLRDGPHLEACRRLFGDDREDYGAALARHYALGPPGDWPERFVSAYASSHPWEDFAETFAHYLHMVDTLETAQAFGVRVRPQEDLAPQARIDFDPHREASLERMLAAWLPLTFAVNGLNRSMGQPDLYPFALTPPVVAKLGFVHARVVEAGGRARRAHEADVLGAMAAALNARVDSATPA